MIMKRMAEVFGRDISTHANCFILSEGCTKIPSFFINDCLTIAIAMVVAGILRYFLRLPTNKGSITLINPLKIRSLGLCSFLFPLMIDGSYMCRQGSPTFLISSSVLPFIFV